MPLGCITSGYKHVYFDSVFLNTSPPPSLFVKISVSIAYRHQQSPLTKVCIALKLTDHKSSHTTPQTNKFLVSINVEDSNITSIEIEDCWVQILSSLTQMVYLKCVFLCSREYWPFSLLRGWWKQQIYRMAIHKATDWFTPLWIMVSTHGLCEEACPFMGVGDTSIHGSRRHVHTWE